MPKDTLAELRPVLEDAFGRIIRYLRLSVTDRCNLRCRYCMGPRPHFLPKSELLSIEDLTRVADVFVGLGVRKVRVTGGEPLARRGVLTLIEALGRRVTDGGFKEVTLTTNGIRLASCAEDLASAGVRRINVSLDTLDPAAYRALTRGGDLAAVLAGIEAARAAGLAVKINAVAKADLNGGSLCDLAARAFEKGCDISFIEMMPLNGGSGRPEGFISADDILSCLSRRWTLTPSLHRTAGPSRYVRVAENGLHIGLISAMSKPFCATCDRVRVTSTGQLYSCLGHGSSLDLKPFLRSDEAAAGLPEAIQTALRRRPAGHDFGTPADAGSSRTMAHTGG